jgi:hypothetical protein
MIDEIISGIKWIKENQAYGVDYACDDLIKKLKQLESNSSCKGCKYDGQQDELENACQYCWSNDTDSDNYTKDEKLDNLTDDIIKGIKNNDYDDEPECTNKFEED